MYRVLSLDPAGTVISGGSSATVDVVSNPAVMQRRDIPPSYDVVVVGSGAGGLLAALRARELGLSVAVFEKATHYGGATAVAAGGTWIPLNEAVATKDTKELAMSYLRAVTQGRSRDSMLETYVDHGPIVMKYLETLGVRFVGGSPFPDYFSELPGALRGRSMLPLDQDGKALGPHFETLRDSHPSSRLLGRYALNSRFANALGNRAPGWKKLLAQIVWDYWSDLPWRLRTRKDRRLTMGRALIGGLRHAMLSRHIDLFLETPMTDLVVERDRVVGIRVKQGTQTRDILATKGVLLASGGFENSQAMRNQYLIVPTRAEHSASPPDGGNTGDPIRAALALGAGLEFMDHAWWCPCMVVPPSRKHAQAISYPVFFDRARPGTLSVNRLGKRFVNESVSYDLYGLAMARDQQATNANAPCWMVFDAGFRRNYPAGAVLPSWAMADRAVPTTWWDNVIYRADSIDALARKTGLPADVLTQTVSQFNDFATSGEDAQFGRGATDAQRALGDPKVKPNPCMAPLIEAPFYAVRLSLGDLGTRGGLTINERGAVTRPDGSVIPGLYATGDATATIFGDTYPGGGAAIGPAMVFGYLAVSAMAVS